jgi:hypothetical protein
VVREPLQWCLRIGTRLSRDEVARRLRRALLGPADGDWEPPSWLLHHQRSAARRLAGSLDVFGGALLCDAVGLGKTYTGLAVGTRYERLVVAAPAVLLPQWQSISDQLGIPIAVVSHESLSRRARIPEADLVIVDEAHWFRNPHTVRYATLARGLRRARLLLLTATPVVNLHRDILSLIRLFAPDNAFAAYGMRSLAEAIARPGGIKPAAAIAPAIIARSPHAAGVAPGLMPQATDQPILTPAPLEDDVLHAVMQSINALEFPAVGATTAAALLRLHLLHRLASSDRACVVSLRRHLRYLDHAVTAARRGEKLTRRAARMLFPSDDDSQLEFALVEHGSRAVTTEALDRERGRIHDLLAALHGTRRSPKLSVLHGMLVGRSASDREGKTVIFTNAVATAMAIASRLEWKRTAVVTGHGARIASGALPVAMALGWFAPRARHVTPPSPHASINILVATDMVSEGLNLQDANAVVHFDLPWNPLRLQQRIGRVARLGSIHKRVDVWWFAPPPSLESQLAVRDRILQKLNRQRDLGVPVTSQVGRARVLGRSLELRERIGEPAQPGYCVVEGPAAAAFAIRWHGQHRTVPQLIVLAGRPPEVVDDLGRACAVLTDLVACPRSDAARDLQMERLLADTLRQRLADAIAGAADLQTRRLARVVLHRAARAGRARRSAELGVLDSVLDVLARGTRWGAHIDLVRALQSKRRTPRRLESWVREWSEKPVATPHVTLEAAIFGDGSRDIPTT